MPTLTPSNRSAAGRTGETDRRRLLSSSDRVIAWRFRRTRLGAVRYSLLVVGFTSLVGCATGTDPKLYAELRALRPEGYGAMAYGLATACRPGSCAAAQRNYHGQFLAILRKYRYPLHPLANSVFAYAQAVAARVDGNELSPAHADSVIQEFRIRVDAEIDRLNAIQAQTDAAYWSAFWQMQNALIQQQATTSRTKPIHCTTTGSGALATTVCH